MSRPISASPARVSHNVKSHHYLLLSDGCVSGIPMGRILRRCHILYRCGKAALDSQPRGLRGLKFIFFALSKFDVFPVLVERCRAHLTGETKVIPGDECHIFLLHPSHLRKTLSEGYHLGVLSAHHAEQVNEECKYGTERTLEYVRYLISNGFPTGTVFTDAGELVAYILCRTDGCMFNGFVRPSHRRKGLYQVVNYDLAGKVVALGQPTAWVYVLNWNEASKSSYRKLGVKPVDSEVYCVDWIEYTPCRLADK